MADHVVRERARSPDHEERAQRDQQPQRRGEEDDEGRDGGEAELGRGVVVGRGARGGAQRLRLDEGQREGERGGGEGCEAHAELARVCERRVRVLTAWV